MFRASKGNKTYKLAVYGRVQGVGFRPFIYREAKALGLTGTAANTPSGAEILVQGHDTRVAEFLRNIKKRLPPNSEITGITRAEVSRPKFKTLTIIESAGAECVSADIPPDIGVCAECVEDIYSKGGRRKNYPFTNCTNCGPRFSIIKSLPYDRDKTTMAGFKLCPECEREYNNPLDRRFHAQPNACPKCGPKLTLFDARFKRIAAGPKALELAVKMLKNGKIAAVKGIGGYHLACDAKNRKAVKLLRERKRRPHKPLAVMVNGLGKAQRFCRVNPAEAELLASPASPIVLLDVKPANGLPMELLAPGNGRLGVMLSYAPLHRLLFSKGRGKDNFEALVMTSGNRSDEPICVDEAQARDKLTGIADCFLTHDRPVHNRCDDSIVFNLRGNENIFIRKSRGFVPDPIKLGTPPGAPDIFAAGAELKNTFCFTRKGRAYQSQYIGDLDNIDASRFYDEAFERFKDFLAVKPTVAAYDLHPDYQSTVFAQIMFEAYPKLKGVAIQHHHAHIASVLAEKGINKPVIGIAFDGNGMGTDGSVWGGECFLARGRQFKRLAHLECFRLPGGDSAVKEIWRLAYSLARRYALKQLPAHVTRGRDTGVIDNMMDRNINSPLTSSMGRLFDAAASLIGIRQEVSFDAQAAMEMESLAVDIQVKKGYNFDVILGNGTEPAVIRVKPLLEGIIRDFKAGVKREVISAKFHFTIAEMILALARKFGAKNRVKDIALSGGVFQNKVLLGLTAGMLEKAGYKTHFNTVVPPNDGGISLGQAYLAAKNVY